MREKIIYIIDNEMKKLRELIGKLKLLDHEDKKYLKELRDELNNGKLVNSQDIPLMPLL